MHVGGRQVRADRDSADPSHYSITAWLAALRCGACRPCVTAPSSAGSAAAAGRRGGECRPRPTSPAPTGAVARAAGLIPPPDDPLGFGEEFVGQGGVDPLAPQGATVRLWQASGGHDQAVLRGHTGVVSALAFSQDGRRLVSASYDRAG